MINQIPQDRLERVQRELMASAPRAQEPVNVQPLMQLGEDQLLEFNGQLLRIPPVPFRAGLRLNELWLRVQTAEQGERTGDAAAACARIIAELVRLMGSLARPTGAVRPLLWRLGYRPNPFSLATEMEVGALVDFFVMCRTKPTVRLSHPKLQSARARKT